MKVLIIGSGGNLGQELMRVYSDLQPIGWSRTDLDITDEQAVWAKINELRPNLIYNAAAYNDIDAAEGDRVTADLVNGYAVGYIAKAAKSAGATLIHFSSGMVFDGEDNVGYTEDDIPAPINAFGRSKLLGEMEAQENTDNFYIIRTSNLFGNSYNKKKKHFVDSVIEQSASGQTINAIDDELSNPTYTLDLAQATRALVEDAKDFGVYHIINTGSTNHFELAKNVLASKNIKAVLAPVKGITTSRIARRPQYEILKNTKFLELRPWTEALREYLSQK